MHTASPVRVVDGIAIVGPPEDPAATSRQLRTLAANGYLQVVLNFAGISNMTAAATADLVSGCSAIILAGGDIKLLHVAARVQRLFRTTRVVRLMDIYADEAAALRSFTPLALPEERRRR